MCCSRSFFLVIFGTLSWRFSWRDFEAVFLRISWGVCMNPSWFFSLLFSSQIREKRGSILGFSVGLGIVVFLVEILQFLLI
jgi:hypothetical protein